MKIPLFVIAAISLFASSVALADAIDNRTKPLALQTHQTAKELEEIAMEQGGEGGDSKVRNTPK